MLLQQFYCVGRMEPEPAENQPGYSIIESLTPLELRDFGILEINIQDQVHYGIGIFIGYRYLITLARYIVKDAKFAVYLPKEKLQVDSIRLKDNLSLREDYFQRFDIKETKLRCNMLISYISQEQSQLFEGIDKIFVCLTINDISRRRCPHLLQRNQIKQGKCSVKTIGLPKDLKQFSLFAKTAELGHVADIKLPQQSAALIYLKKGNEYYLYGLFDNVNGLGSEDYFLSKELKPIKQMISGLSDNQVYICDEEQYQIVDANTKFPYNSIGILLYQRTGTAQALFDKDNGQCKYLITCAHNFLGYDYIKQQVYDYLPKIDKFSFSLLSTEIPEQPGRYYALKKCPQLKIKSVHIRDTYYNIFKSSQPDPKYTLNFSNEPTTKTLNEHSLNDIAFIQLAEPLKFNKDQQAITFKNGFRLNVFEKPFSQINLQKTEITGFPGTKTFDKIYKKQYTSSVSKSKRNGKDMIQLSKDKIKQSEGSYQIIRHYMSILGGNSGSAIYQKNEGQFYLFGIHIEGKGGKEQKKVKFANLNQSSLTFGQKTFTYGYDNAGTYLYNANIYQWFLKLPFIHNVTDHYKELISSIAVIEYQQSGQARFGLGLMNQNCITFPSSSKQISGVYVKNHSKMSDQENILQFDLSQEVYEPIKFDSADMSIDISGFTKLLVSSSNFNRNYFTVKKFNGENLSQYKGLAISIAKKQATQNKPNLTQDEKDKQEDKQRVLSLKIQVFNAKDMQTPASLKINSPALLFVFDFEKRCLIWSYYDKESQKKEPVPQLTDNQYFSRAVSLRITSKSVSFVGTANILFDKKHENCRYLITAAHNIVNERGQILQPQNYRIRYQFQGGEISELNYYECIVPKQYIELLQQERFDMNSEVKARGANKQDHYPVLRKSTFFNIALIRLGTALQVQCGFTIKRRENLHVVPTLLETRTVGFNPVEKKLVISAKGNVDLVQYDDNLLILKHNIQTSPGFGGCAISHSDSLLGIHTSSIGKRRQNGAIVTSNKFATYIYQPQIYAWIQSILGKENVME